MLNLHGISKKSFDAIVSYEVTSKAMYVKKYQAPEWPGEASGVTIGIGYDVGQNSRAQFRADWNGKLPEPMLAILERACGVKGAKAKPLAAAMRANKTVSVPWDVANDVFSNHDVPRYLAICEKALPGFDDLTPTCKGVILSITFNRGASYNNPDPRYREMRAIKACIASGNLKGIPAQIRSMKRLWPSVPGLLDRRDAEAKMFEAGLLEEIQVPDEAPDETSTAGRPPREPIGDQSAADDSEPADPSPAQPSPIVVSANVPGDPVIYSVQSRLKAMNYSPGLLEGKWGGMLAGAIGGFINDRNLTIPAPTSLEMFQAETADITSELTKAESEGFKRPVAEARANANAKMIAQVAPEIVPAKRSLWATISAAIVAFFTAIWDTILSWWNWAWNLLSDHKDSIPTDPSTIGQYWEYLGKVPHVLWGLLIAAFFVVLAITAHSSIKKITTSVQTGARQ